MMTVRITIVLFSCLIVFQIQAQDGFYKKYPDSKEPVDEVWRRCNLITEYAHHSDHQAEWIFSIAAPEVAMYNTFLDIMETSAAEIFYVQLGGNYGDFSIGQFQIKPSFAEALEEKIKSKCQSCTYADRLKYSSSNPVEKRKIRVQRLRDLYWQQVYLISFIELMDKKWQSVDFADQDMKLKYYASAYNLGMDRTFEELGNWIEILNFPGRARGTDFAYSMVSSEIYSDLIHIYELSDLK